MGFLAPKFSSLQLLPAPKSSQIRKFPSKKTLSASRKHLLLPWFAQYYARNSLEFFIIDYYFRIERIELLGFFEIFGCLTVHSECLGRKSAPEISIGILGIPLNNLIEIAEGLLVILDHLVCFGSLMIIPHIRRLQLNALRKREDGFLVLLEEAVGEADVVVDVGDAGGQWRVLQGQFQYFDCKLELLIALLTMLEVSVGVVGQAHSVQDT